MNFEKLAQVSVGVVLSFALTGQLPKLRFWIQKANAQILWESRASAWGNPDFLNRDFHLDHGPKPRHRRERGGAMP